MIHYVMSVGRVWVQVVWGHIIFIVLASSAHVIILAREGRSGRPR